MGDYVWFLGRRVKMDGLFRTKRREKMGVKCQSRRLTERIYSLSNLRKYIYEMHRTKGNFFEGVRFVFCPVMEGSFTACHGVVTIINLEHQLMTSYNRIIVAEGGSGKVGPGAVPPDSGPRC